MKKILFLLTVLLFSLAATMRADNTIVEVGTVSSTNQKVPFYPLYKYSLTQQIYTADEIGTEGAISSISFDVLEGDMTRTVNIYMKHVARSSFDDSSSWEPLTDADLVVSNASVAFQAGWTTIELTTPFNYNGTDNLLVCLQDVTGSWTNDKITFNMCSATHGSLRIYGDSPFDVSNCSGGFLDDIKNHVRFSIDVQPTNVTAPANIDMGGQPNGVWKFPFSFNLSNSGKGVTVKSIESDNDYFKVNTVCPFKIPYGATVPVEMTTGVASPGVVNGKLTVKFDGNLDDLVVNVTATAYDPVETDVIETAGIIASFPYQSQAATANLHRNYEIGQAADAKEAVYKVTFDKEVLFSAGTSGSDPMTRIYREDFGGEETPGIDNYYEYNGPEVLPGPQDLTFTYPYNGGTTYFGLNQGGDFYFGYRITPEQLQELGLGTCSIVSVKAGAREGTVYRLLIMKGGEEPDLNNVVYEQECTDFEAMQYFTIELDEPQLLGDEENIWIMFYSNSPYAARCGKDFADLDNGKIWYSLNSTAWYTTTSYTPIIYTRFVDLPTNQEVKVNLADMSVKRSAPVRRKTPDSSPTYQIEDMFLSAGTYYVVVASTSDNFDVNMKTADAPLPEPVAFDSPLDGGTDLPAYSIAKWKVGNYTKEMQVLLDTKNPAETVLTDWTDQLVNSTALNLKYNTTYYLQVNERNASGTTNSEVISFTTTTAFTITATANPTEGGTVSGAGDYAQGKTVKLTATPNFGYEFVNWTVGNNVVSTDNPYSFTASKNLAVVANFKQLPHYTVTLAEGTADADNWTITPAEATTTGLAEGATVTLKYDGTRKVKSVKAVVQKDDKAFLRVMPLTMEALTDGNIKVNIEGTLETGMKYSVNDGEKTLITTTTTIDVKAGDKVQFYGNGTSTSCYGMGTPVAVRLLGTAQTKVYGNIMSLLDETGYETLTTLGDDACVFHNLFYENANLTDASGLLLPATTLTVECYSKMFSYCTSLTAAPELPATTLASSCYFGMFLGCTALTTAPMLPATTLAKECYMQMFTACTALTTAPVLPATTLAEGCYKEMFDRCWKLSSVTCLATGTISTEDTEGWLKAAGEDVTGTKTFTADASATWPEGDSGIPSGWTRKTPDGSANVAPVTLATPLTMEALTDGNIQVNIKGTLETGMKYSVNDGEKTLITTTTTIDVKTGDKVQFYGNGTSTSCYGNGIPVAVRLLGTAQTKVYGNIMSLLDETGYETLTTLGDGNSYVFHDLFSENANLTDASGLLLPATTLTVECYSGMFYGCTSLTAAPELPATTLVMYCYKDMFRGCTSLTTAPVLPATTLAKECYMYMFKDCTSLTTAPVLPATTLASSCYNGMFLGCTSLTTAPMLPATTLAEGCYQEMFNQCWKLSSVTCLATGTISTEDTEGWLKAAGEDVTGTKTFTADASATWPEGDSGIPSGWTRKNAVAINWTDATMTSGSLTMPAGNVVIEVEYYPNAVLADGDVAPAAAAGPIYVETDAALVTAGQASQGTLMYLALASTAEAPTTANAGWSTDVPKASTITEPGTYYVWYYIVGDDTHNDSEIFDTPLKVNVLSNKFDVTFTAKNANSIEDGKATVTIDGTAITLEQGGKLTAVKMGSTVTINTAEGYKFRKVEVKKDVFVDATYGDAENNCAPKAESGWELWQAGERRTPGENYNYNGTRIYNNLNLKGLKVGYYCNGQWPNGYMLYGTGELEGAPTLALPKGSLNVTYYAANWNIDESREIHFQILNSEATTVVADKVTYTTPVNMNRNRGANYEADKFQFTFNCPETGLYTIKLGSPAGETLIGNISIVQDGIDVTTNAAQEGDTFTEASFTMSANDRTIEYELVRDMEVDVTATIANRIHIQKENNTYVAVTPTEIVPAVTDAISGTAVTMTETNDYTTKLQKLGDDNQWSNATNLSVGTFRFMVTGTGLYDGITYTNEFQLFEGYEVEIAAGEYATFYKDEALTLDPEDTEAKLYTITAVGETTATVTECDVIPAKTPLLVKNNSQKTRNILLIPTDNAPLSFMYYEGFLGTLEATTIAASDATTDRYAFNGKQFVWVKNAIAVGANKAWLEIPAANNARAINLVFGDATKITTTDFTDDTDGEFYDLNGRKFQSIPTKKGVYIMNGRKVVIK